MFEPTSPSPVVSDIERIAVQVQHLESRSGRRAASLQIRVPPGTDPESVREALREALDAPALEVGVEHGRGRSRVVTIEFDLESERSAS